MQSLLGDLAFGDQAAAVPHRAGQRVIDPVGHDPALPLASQMSARRIAGRRS
jgi:hypothetical protein